ncbi:AraC family transcriptional regulator [Burkholderia gladioli]|uniref:AraC family transcriptional regulator n=1 Tax=Burkholderia gladioli TaxID=28095 RepID=UPI00163E583D|nr:helix-turn-helix transcriptional regulator [Burkholderia gladioli]
MIENLALKHLDFHDTDRAMCAMDVNWPSGTSTGWHAHPKAQLLYAIEGVMAVRSMACSWVVPPNRALWLAAGVEHVVKMSGDVKMHTVFIDAAAIGLPLESCVINVSPLLRELVVAAVRVPRDYSDDTQDGRLMRLLADELLTADVLPLHLPAPQDARIKSICAALVDDPANASTVGQWAATLGVTAKTVHRLFQKETGMTFGQWRDQARFLFALRQLAQGRRIIDIALDCGYSSPSAFTAMFRRYFGVPPSVFHRQLEKS